MAVKVEVHLGTAKNNGVNCSMCIISNQGFAVAGKQNRSAYLFSGVLLLACCLMYGFTASPDRSDEYGIILTAPPTDAIPLRLIVEWQTSNGASANLHRATKAKALHASIDLLIYATHTDWLADYAELVKHPMVRAVQFDYRVNFRRTPNDSFFQRQNNLTRAGFTQVWDENTGGKTATGDQIVIAILDAGFDITHEDLVDNLWVNAAEIPGDRLDNDGNGFIDDVHGWNFVRDNSDIRPDLHGTQVTGILGAKGDNGLGIAGTGWDNRVMVFSILEVSHIIAAYAYIEQQRQLWQDSNGERGAFIVATNASFGLEGRSCTEFPVWGNMYDRLGQVGILTAASTANRRWDVDDFGDMPTTCPSEFLLGVANSGPEDRLWESSAYGRVSVDLAAPGEGTYTTGSFNGYSNFASTSAAAPYVTGAIALLYSQDCDRLLTLAQSDPKAAARLVRRTILQSVTTSDAYFNLLATEGQLNVWSAWQKLRRDCTPVDGNGIQITNVYPNPTSGTIRFEFSDISLGPYTIDIYTIRGQLVSTIHLPVGSAFPISNTLELGELKAGTYLLDLRNEAGSQAIRKVVIF
ncbi:MAG: S8/S53 family peptidase [Bacteroidota bacterium]